MPKMADWFSPLQHKVRVAGSKPGDEYVVTISGTMPRWCTCPSFEHRAGLRGEFCKHMKARHGRSAIGRTRCASCKSYLTPEEIVAAKYVDDIGHDRDQIICFECFSSTE